MGKRYLGIIEEKLCVGCGACYNKCPVGALEMLPNEEGFLTPVVDEEKCINCGMCKKVCPSINTQYNNRKDAKCYAAGASDEIRLGSSSGGIFTLLAEYVINKGGYVCGVAFDEKNWSVNHIIVSDMENLQKLRKSKYVQSNTGKTYSEIKKLLEDDKFVLFSGTPCQVAGLYGFLGKDYDNLLTADLVCHGVPSEKTFKEFLSQIASDEEITSVSFREKEVYNWATSTTIKFKNKETYRKRYTECDYFRGFQYNLFLKEHCTSCKFSKLPRQADISLGDFWGYRRFDKKLSDKKGIGIVVTNNDKGEFYFKEIFGNLKFLKEVSLKKAIKKSNPNIDGSFKVHPNRKKYFVLKKDMDFKKALHYAMGDTYDICLLPSYRDASVGSRLSLNALLNTLQNYKLQTLVVSNDSTIEYEANKYNYQVYNVETAEDKLLLNDKSDKFLFLGEIHNNDFNEDLLLQKFIFDNKLKLSYGLSFFDYNFSTDSFKKNKIMALLSRQDKLSNRETYGFDILNDCNLSSTKVLDSIFLLDKEQYDLIATQTEQQSEYVFMDCSRDIEEKDIFVKQVFENKDIKKLKNNVSLEDYVSMVKNSEFVITDSYYTICLAIILNKQFIVIESEPDYISPIESLLNEFNLKDRLLYSRFEYNNQLEQKIEYGSINEELAHKRQQSLDFIKECINLEIRPKQYSQNDYYIIEELEKESKLELQKKLLPKKNISNLKYNLYKFLEKISLGKQKQKCILKLQKYKDILNVFER